jgi:hypothetical protein
MTHPRVFNFSKIMAPLTYLGNALFVVDPLHYMTIHGDARPKIVANKDLS